MEVDNVEPNGSWEDHQWGDYYQAEENYPTSYPTSYPTTEELNYMTGKNGYKGKGKGKPFNSWGKGFNQFANPKGKGKDSYPSYQKGEATKGDKGGYQSEKGKGKGTGFQGHCYHCGEFGHSQNQCWWKYQQMNQYRQSQGVKGWGKYDVQCVKE